MNKANGMFPNVLHGDKWKITFSNIPNLQDMSEMKYFDNYIKSCSIPPYSMGEIHSHLPDGWMVRHPLGGMRKNQDMGNITLSFKMSEDMYNYLIFFTWMQQLRYGALPDNYEDLFRKYSIKRLTISMLDNQKRTISELYFTNLFLLELGSLDLQYGVSEEVAFSCSFSYEQILYNIQNPMVGGSDLGTPVSTIQCGTSGVPINPDLSWNV